MDQEMRDKLSELVEELTTSGEPQLNQAKMKEVKKICKYESFSWLTCMRCCLFDEHWVY